MSTSSAPESSSAGGLLAIGELLVDAISTDFVADLSEATTLRVVAGGSPANLCRFVRQGGGQGSLQAAGVQCQLALVQRRARGSAGLVHGGGLVVNPQPNPRLTGRPAL